MLMANEVKARATAESILRHYGSEPDTQGRWRCLFPVCHTNGDARHSLTIHGDRVTCWSHGCFRGADVFEIIEKMEGITDFKQQVRKAAQLAGLAPGGHAERRTVELYGYVDKTNALLFQVVRYDPKDFRQRRPDGNGGWIWTLDETPRVLYRLPDVLQETEAPIVVHEGEKAVEVARAAGLAGIHTTSSGGAKNARQTDWSPVAGKSVVICPDRDKGGEDYLRDVADLAKKAGAKSFKVLRLPGLPPKGDVVEWLAGGGTAEAFHSLLNDAEEFCFTSPPKKGGVQETNFSPVTASDFLDAEHEADAVEWVLDEFLPTGGLGLLAGKPKEGKSTLAYELAVKVAKGQPFLNRPTCGGSVLILGLEEHPRDMRLRLQALGGEGLQNLFVFAGQLKPAPDTFDEIKRFAVAQRIKLIVVDTLSALWNVRDENDAAAVSQAARPLLALARETEACVLLIHHARKSEGSYGDEIRGSGALFAAVDVAMIIKRHEIQTQRVLHAVSRYPETPAELVLELRETGYCTLGDPSSLNRQARQEKIKAALTESFESRETISQRSGIAYRDACRLLDGFADRGEVLREGRGRKGDPFRYRRNSIPAPPPVLGGTLQETNSALTGFDSCDPPPPCKNRIEDAQESGSFDVPEFEPVEVIDDAG